GVHRELPEHRGMESLQANVHAKPHAGRDGGEDSGAVPVRHLGAQHEHEHSSAQLAAGPQRERSGERDVGRDGCSVSRAMTEGRGKREAGRGGMWGWGRGFGASLLLFSVGCYEYREARVTDVRPDATVHVVLSAEAATALAGTIGPNATAIDGRVMSVDTRTLRLSATQIARAVGPEEFLRDEPIDVPASG